MPTLYESWNPETLRGTMVTEDAGKVYLSHSQDTRPIVESAKRIASDFDPLVRRDTIHVARIPIGVYRQLERDGVVQDRARFTKWLNERDNAVFRTDDRSTL